MSKLLVIFGATGQQGGSVIDYILNDAELSQKYRLRGVTRQPSQPAAGRLIERGVEVVRGDLDDENSLKDAMKGAHTIFAVTTTIYDEQCKEREVRQGKAIADVAVASGAQYLIFSTLSSATKISKGKYAVDSFDSKAEVEEYIRGLPIQSAFFAPGGFMENFMGGMAPRPSPDGSGTYTMTNVVTPDTNFPLIATVLDSGKYVGAILAEPEKYQGKVLSASTELYSFDRLAKIMSKATGKTVKYQQIPADVFRSFMPPVQAEVLTNMMLFHQDYGYYGPDTKELVEWTAQQARGKLTTLEEFLKKMPLKLE